MFGEKKMRKILLSAFVLIFSLLLAIHAFGQGGLYLGVQAGYSAQKPSLKDIEFNTDTTFLYGVRAGVKIMMIAVEVNYFQAAHNLELKELVTFEWGEREIDYSYLGLNLKYFFPLVVLNPYVTFGYGYYTADIRNIDEDKGKGFNLGVGLELSMGGKFSLLAEGKYHHANLDIDERELKLGDFTFSAGVNIYF
jgi:hypothetical protein